MYACSGKQANGLFTKSVERLDTVNNRWETLADCNFETVMSLLLPLNDRFIVKLGGIAADGKQCDQVERYDCFTNVW